MRSFYDILGVEESSTSETVKRAYFDFLRRVHPDKQAGDCEEDAAELVGQAKVIWSTLREPESRRQYDNWLREQRLRELKGTVVESIEIAPDEEEIEEQCRCGDFYQVTPEELKQIVDVGVFECGSCSLCLQITKLQ